MLGSSTLPCIPRLSPLRLGSILLVRGTPAGGSDFCPVAVRLSSSSSCGAAVGTSQPPASPTVVYDRHYIGGEWVRSSPPPSASGDVPLLEVFDSNTGVAFARVASGTSRDASLAVDAASSAFLRGERWSRPSSLPRRMDAVRAVAEEYERRRPEVSAFLQRELGAPAKFARDVQAALFGHHAENFLEAAATHRWEEDLGRSLVAREPVGVVAAITPWNWPVHQIAAKVIPALLAGCSVVLKPSEVAPLNAFILAEAIHGADVLPPGVFNLVCGTGTEVGEALATHPDVDMVSFTGSTEAGRRVHALGADTVKRVRTELGGKSAAVVLDDADLEMIRKVALSVLQNSGQSCNALGRMLAPRDRYDEVVDVAREAFESARVVEAHDPSAGRNDIGPLASERQLERVRGYVRAGVREGARLVVGGIDPPEDVPGSGYFVRPTLFADVRPRMVIAREEIFGPVLCVMPYSDVDDAVDIANDTIYGLSNAVIGRDDERAMAVARRLRSGEVFVNTLSQSPVAPFGGYGQSGDGRELGAWGLEEFLQVKAIHRRPPARRR